MEEQLICLICNNKHFTTKDNKIQSVIAVKSLAIKKLIAKSVEKDDNKWKQWENKTCIYVHDNCRRKYFQQKSSISNETVSILSASTSSLFSDDIDQFNFKDNCFVCGLEGNDESSQIINRVYFSDRILYLVNNLNDNTVIKKRIYDKTSLIGVRLHDKCHEELITISKKIQSEKSKTQLKLEDSLFVDICNYLESARPRAVFLSELKKIMTDKTIETDTLFRRLTKKYGNYICIQRHKGKDSIIFFNDCPLTKIYTNWLLDDTSLSEGDTNIILKFAAEILFKNIKSKTYDTNYYNTPGKFFESVEENIPELLLTFLKYLFEHKNRNVVDIKKIYNLSHIMVSIIRPKSFLSHLHLAIGIYIHRKTGSKLIIEILSSLGICVPYHQLRLFEASVIMDPPKVTAENTFVQHVFDNTDHNAQTIDGHSTFHNLGGIRTHTPEHGVTIQGSSRKLTIMPSPNEIVCVNKIPDATLPNDYESGWKKIVYLDPYKMILATDSEHLPSYYTPYLWAKHFKVSNVPLWKGYMEVMTRDKIDIDISRIECLPFINHNPSDITTIYTSLIHALNETRKLGQKTCIVTYDQPLYKKAIEITRALNLPITVRLGGLHIIMAYLAAICYCMRGSGLAELWGTVYAPYSVKFMLTGHAIVRGIRAHILSYTAIASLICRDIDQSGFKEHVESFFKNFGDDGGPLLGDCKVDANIAHMSNKFIEKLNEYKNSGPTAKLWVQYFDSVTILLQFIEADRTGNWELHLQSVRKMLPLFHSTGHYLYAECAHVYLQDMINLEARIDSEEFYKYAHLGYFSIRRTDKPFNGIPTDMVIEQTLNRFFGTDLVHGRGVTDSVVARYLSAMPSCFMIMEGLEEYCGVVTSNSEQQVDLNKSRMKIDDEHLQKFIFWLNHHNPFTPRNTIVSLSTGVMGGSRINCHKAFEIGQEALNMMTGKIATEIKIRRTYLVKNLESARSEMHLFEKNKDVDATLLFKTILSSLTTENIKRNALKFELSPYPLSLFDKNGFMRQPDDKLFYSSFKKLENISRTFFNNLTLVIDGNYLLHNAVTSWPHGSTYYDICELYFNYLQQKYTQQLNSNELYIVFENYNNEVCGVKSYELYRSQKKNIASDFQIDLQAIIINTKKEFLSNVCNKIKFILLLQQYLTEKKLNVITALQDGDQECVKLAITLKSQFRKPIGIISDNMNIFILLISLTQAQEHMYFCKYVSEARIELYSASDFQDIHSFLLFVHAFCGCYSTSSIYNKGKNTVLKLIKNNIELQNTIKIFYQRDSSMFDICKASEIFMKNIYNATSSETIEETRYSRFNTSTPCPEIEKRLSMLPPTISATHEHGKRVYYQIQQWTGNLILQPEQWGWKRQQIILMPVMTSDPPAPEELCQKINCGCTTSRCKSKQCKCRKSGILCSNKCRQCTILGCQNSSSSSTEDDQHTDEENNDVDNINNENIEEEQIVCGELNNDNNDNTDFNSQGNININHKRRSSIPTFNTRWASSYDNDDLTDIPFDSF